VAGILVLVIAGVVLTVGGSDHRGSVEAAHAAGVTPSASAGAVASGAAGPSASSSTAPTPTPTGTGASRTTTAPNPQNAPAHFGTLAPSATLPSGAQCATWVRATPYQENKGANAAANKTTGHHVGSDFFSGDDPRANTVIAPRVDGQFTGTTHQILRWAACKWGIDEDIVYAQASVESWWQQNTLGDWGTDASRCAPGRGLGVDGKAGQCPESFGILQNRYPYETSSWPGIANSTAMNADLAYGIWRTCFMGYEGWLNTVDPSERVGTYAAGDAWGCIGRWFSGRWHTSASEGYITRVKDWMNQRIWETPNFQQP
jgi:autotransporter family porin